MRSVDVVFPAPMCAMIPMLRVSSSLNALPIAPVTAFFSPARVATASLTKTIHSLPTVMRERLVRFCHAVYVFLLLHSSAARIRRINQLVRELVHHGLARAFPRILQQPANRQRLPPKRIHFHWNLVVRAAHAPRLHFQQRLHVLDGLLENLQCIVVGLLRHLIHRAVKHALRRRLLAFPHHRADELLHNVAGIDRIGRLRSPENESFAWHCSLSLLRQIFPAQMFFGPHRIPLSPILNVEFLFSNFCSATSLPRPLAASPHTSTAPACGSQRPPHPAFRARCDTARPADPSRVLRAPARSSVPAGCGRPPEYTSSLQWHSSAARAPLCAVQSSASSASACTRECTLRASPGSPPRQATSSSSGPLHVPSLPVAKTSAQSSLNRARKFLSHRHPARMREGFAAPARLADKMARERNPVLKGLLRIRRYNQQETPYAPQELELLSWLQFGEAYSALRGWRPIPAALLSHSVLLCSGTEDNSLPTQRLRTHWSRPTQGNSVPDKHRSIEKKALCVKSLKATPPKSLWESVTCCHSYPPRSKRLGPPSEGGVLRRLGTTSSVDLKTYQGASILLIIMVLCQSNPPASSLAALRRASPISRPHAGLPPSALSQPPESHPESPYPPSPSHPDSRPASPPRSARPPASPAAKFPAGCPYPESPHWSSSQPPTPPARSTPPPQNFSAPGCTVPACSGTNAGSNPCRSRT